MDGARIGGDVRLLRRRRGWSQRRLAVEARVSRWVVMTLESRRAGTVRIEDAVAVVAALDGFLSIRVLFHGEALDRMRDARHAELVECLVQILRSLGWEVATEVSFNHFGERGSIDLLAFHPSTGTLLVVEVKSVVPDLGGALMTIDRKVRLAPDIARKRGWIPRVVARLMVLPEDSTARRRVRLHEATFRNAFPARNVQVNAWLRDPTGTLSGLLFLSSARGDSHRPMKDVSRARRQGRSRTNLT
ncbi:MAG TPA: hypothetical protein VIB02_10000 [Candidatus Limnocylindrales bacterium]|jgi:transcriptional regulator with XRE-family HTH domain